MNSNIKKIFLIILFLNFAIIEVYFLMFVNIKKRNENFLNLTNQLKEQSQKENQVKFIQANLNETKEEREKMNNYFVSENERGIADFMDYIEKIGSVAGVKLKISSLSFSSDDKKIKKEEKSDVNDITEKLRLNLGVSGDWKSVTYFLQLLESLPYGIEFNQVNLEKTTNEKKEDIWNGNFGLNVLKLI